MSGRFAPGTSPKAVFQKMGLRTRAALFPFAAPRARVGLSSAGRFRDSLEELGGLYATFGRFLLWRADLLRPDYLNALRGIRVSIPPLPRQDAIAALCRDFGAKGERLAASLSDEPVWSNLSRCAWRGVWEGQPVLVQLVRHPVPREEFSHFAKAMATLREPGIAGATRPEVLAQFESWLRLADSSAREGSYLETLHGFPQKTLVEYPNLIREFCSPAVLCWHWVEGETLSNRVATGSADVVEKLAETLLEQACLIGVVDAELDLSTMAVDAAGRVVMRRATRMVAIPAAMSRNVLKYITAVLTGDSPYANHQLIRLGFGYSSSPMETRLFDELSNLEPELKVNLRFPASVGAFESNWRALARIRRERPLYLDAFHRNLVAAGYLDADSPRTGQNHKEDAVSEAQWPVVGRLLRARLGDLTTRDAGSQWILGSGLVALEGIRQATRLADGFRGNDLAFTFSPGHSEEPVRSANREVRTRMLLAVLLVVFLICLRWGANAAPPLSGVLAVAAVITAVLLLGLLWRTV